MSMSYILNIETATKNCSVSLSKSGSLIALREKAEEGYSHAEKLHIFIDEVLKEAGISYHELSAVAVSMGPGSYTGLRIGVSAAKGLCFALNIPLIALDTLEILAVRVTAQKGVIVPMIDARRMEVFSAVFDSNHKKIRSVQAEILTEASFQDKIGEVHFVGDCLEKCKTVLISENFIFHDDMIFPSANEMSALSWQHFTAQQFVDLAYFEPYYLKDFFTPARKS